MLHETPPLFGWSHALVAGCDFLRGTTLPQRPGQSRMATRPAIRRNNLKGVDLDVPLGELPMVARVSETGSPRSAFDTVYGEGSDGTSRPSPPMPSSSSAG